MKTKLREGQVIKSLSFSKGTMENGIVEVGNYEDNWIYGIFSGNPCVDENRKNKEYLVLQVIEDEPDKTYGKQIISYKNKIVAIELNEDGAYNEHNQKISFETLGCREWHINEDDIQIVAEMKKVYVRQEL
ncbi:hypothetical protein [Bacillus cereus group sp. BfR-BA-01328]|uniref:hypothetical protein n=1 Tax=Bacillus cereus group sp. BfR-BA-01328 TaxID=2920304 RepID=UPI001F57E07C